MLRQIEHQYPKLSRSEQRVAQWVLTHPRKAVSLSVAKVAAASGVSEPTVVRFCRSLGQQGFKSFKLKLADSLREPGHFLHHDVTPDDHVADAAAKVVEHAARSLDDLRRQLASMPFELAVERLAQARQLIFIGLGASGHVANDAAHKFFRLGIPTTSITDTPSILQAGAIADERDVLMVISNSGSNREVIAAMRVAQSNGSRVLALTQARTELAGVADLLFPLHIDEDTSIYTPMSSRLVQLTILDALQVALALALGEAAAVNLERSKNALRATR